MSEHSDSAAERDAIEIIEALIEPYMVGTGQSLQAAYEAVDALAERGMLAASPTSDEQLRALLDIAEAAQHLIDAPDEYLVTHAGHIPLSTRWAEKYAALRAALSVLDQEAQ